MFTATEAEKAREVCDLICLHGHTLEGTSNSAKAVYDLRGAGRVTVERGGLRRDYTIEASGVQIKVNSWRGQIGSVEAVKGQKTALNRILENARTIRDIVVAEKAHEADATMDSPAPRV